MLKYTYRTAQIAFIIYYIIFGQIISESSRYRAHIVFFILLPLFLFGILAEANGRHEREKEEIREHFREELGMSRNLDLDR